MFVFFNLIIALSPHSNRVSTLFKTRLTARRRSPREMKANHGLALLLFAFLLFSSSFARPLSTATQVVLGGGKPEADDNQVTGVTDLSRLMGMEAEESCGDKDEECLERRLMADAHLDYIYTQNHKP